jgi:hypothetical protein
MGHASDYDDIDPAVQAAALSGAIAGHRVKLSVSSSRNAGWIQVKFGH